jgi:transglutaminase-like putative cysteine protease
LEKIRGAMKLKFVLFLMSFGVIILLAMVAVLGVNSSKTVPRHFELSDKLELSITNADDIIETIHNGLANHAQSFTIKYNADGDYLNEASELADELVEYAMYNTNSPTEGDYVRYQYGGYKLSYSKTDTENIYEYELTITPIYYSTVDEENKVDEKVEEILEGLDIGKKASDFEKISAVYDYVCSNVKYDHVHENNPHYYKDSTAYAALVKGYASCQGYAVAMFRLLKELGVECEVVTGMATNESGNEEFHAWNRVLVDGEYYELDATWDAGKEEYEYLGIN